MSEPEKSIEQIKEEKLEKIIEEKVEKKTQKLEKQNQKVKEQNEELKKEVQKLRTNSNIIQRTISQNREGISRREFLKKAGLSTASLAALMSPVSGLNVKSDSFSVQTNNGTGLTEGLFVDQNADVKVSNGDLNLNNNNLTNVNKINGENPSGGANITHNVPGYGDLPLEDRNDRPIYYVENEGDYVVPAQLVDVVWISLQDYNAVAGAIPDSAIAHYDAQSLSGYANGDPVETWNDKSGAGNNATGGSPLYQDSAINGNPALEFNGTDDNFTASVGSYSQPNTFIAVVSHESTGVNGFPLDSANTSNLFLWRASKSEWQISAGNFIGGGSNNGTSHYLLTGIFDGADSELRVNGTTVGTGNAGTDGLDGLYIGSQSNDDNYLDGDYGEALVCKADLRSTNELATQEQLMAERWGITI